MTEALLFVGTGSLLAFGTVTLVVATLALRDAWRYVGLAEGRMEHLREGQARLLTLLSEERQVPKEEPERQLAEELERERRAHREAERRIEYLERELQVLRGQKREVRRESSPPVPAQLLEDRTKVRRGLAGEKPLPTRKAQGAERTPRPGSFLETSARRPAENPPTEDGEPRLGVWHPHPDDDPGRVPSGQKRAKSGAPVEMFRRHYDKYLENYQGYVELAEVLYRMRDDGGVPPGSREEREWEDRLRRLNDGIERTTARLDILERHNPELVADDRVSRRASVARRYSKLEGDGRGR